MNKKTVLSCDFGGRPITIETGRMAKQADGSVLVTYGETVVLVTAVSNKKPKPGQSFFPLTVDYAEKYYASGKFPGGFFKRESRPSNDATLTARLIDRPLRPLFPEGYLNDTQVIATVLSVDLENDPEIAASLGASAALTISDIPFAGPTAAVRMGRVNGKYVINPTLEQQKQSDIEILIAGTEHAIMMVEGGAHEVPEAEVLEAILQGHRSLKPLIEMQRKLREMVGVEKRTFTPAAVDESLKKAIQDHAGARVTEAYKIKEKHARRDALALVQKESFEKVLASVPAEKKAEKEKELGGLFENITYYAMREMVLNGVRLDGRNTTTVRPIEVEVDVLPRTHGSSLFTRGETQVLAVVTLGTKDDEQLIDTMRIPSFSRKFMLHYNFPPFSVGEAGFMRGPGRREIGHGALAERAIEAMLPDSSKFPYTLRVVCETLESNGSSSMGSVCSASMALMDAGVPFPKPVAGIAMGLVKEGERVAVLTDILGDEDHLGDMDFKVAGTKDGITAIQMDIKIEGVNEAIMRQALKQAYDGRLHILGEMENAIKTPKSDLSKNAPRILTMTIKQDKIRDVIGSGGKVIRGIIESTGAKIDINDDGVINIASVDLAAARKAIAIIESIVEEVQVGKIYTGKVKKIMDFGAFVEVTPGNDGLLHISEITHDRIKAVGDVLKEGDVIDVKVLDVDRQGKMRLSRKVLLDNPAAGPGPTKNPQA
ncbi:MAG: polyribonucleotide nucleotidyltransferase [Proteobacteria bacterium]|nr:MAG: polyribonucleotide nucleotidyltransferase [Pseudomonadota bacterium]